MKNHKKGGFGKLELNKEPLKEENMKKTKLEHKKKKILRIILLTTAGLLGIIAISTYLLLHSYINKMNLVSVEKIDAKTFEVEASFANINEDDMNNEEAFTGKKKTTSETQNTDSGKYMDNASSTENASNIDSISNTDKNGNIEDTNNIDQYGGTDNSVSLENNENGIDAGNNENIGSTGDNYSADNTSSYDSSEKEQNQTGEFKSTSNEANDSLNTLNEQIKTNVSKNSSLTQDDKITNILFIGSDINMMDHGGRADNIMVISINKETKKLVTTTFYNDIYLQIPGFENNQLNMAYTYGGADLLIETLQQNFKFKIDHYIMVDYNMFINIVDAVGGIQVKVEDSELKGINNMMTDINVEMSETKKKDYLKSSGSIVLNGKQALAYSRYRFTGKNDPESIRMRKEFVIMIYEKVKDQNLLEMNDLLNRILPNVTTDFTETEILTNLLMFPAYLNYDLEIWSVPVEDSYNKISSSDIEILGIDFNQNIKKINQKIFNINSEG